MIKQKTIFLSILMTILWLTVKMPLYGLDISHIHFDVLDIKNGLSQNSVSYILQDSKGFVWFCTNDGLNRYDGYNFLKFERQPDNKNSLISNYTTCIAESSPGIFWIGTEKGFSVMFFETKEYINNENPGAIKKIIVEDSNTVWMQTQYSLYKIRLIKDGSKYRKHTVSIEPMNAYKEVICKKDEHHLLLTGRDNYLHSYDIRTKIFQKISTSEIWKILISKKINQAEIDKNNNFWIATNYGLYKTDASFTTLDSFVIQRKNLSALQDKIMAITKGKAGNIYIATLQHGLLIFDIKRNKFIEYQTDPYNLTSLPDNKTMSLLIDNSGALWVGTKSAGVAFFSQFKFKFKLITQEPFKTTWLTSKYILSFQTDKNENIWMGTDGGGLYKYNSKEDIFSNWRNNNSYSSLSNDIVQSLLIDSYDHLWVGTLNGICKFNPATNTFIRYFFTSEKNPHNLRIPAYTNIRLFESSNKEIYALNDYAIYHFNTFKNKFEPTLFDFRNSNIVPLDILEDKDSSWWIASSVGLLHLNIRTGYIQNTSMDSLNNNYFRTDQLNCLLPEGENKLWIGTGNNGLFLLNKEKFQIEDNYTEKNGLSNNFINGLLRDNSGKLWMSTNKGISVFNPKNRTFRNFDVNDGLQSNEFNNGAFYKTGNNELLFGGNNGFNIIDADNIPFNSYKPFSNIVNIKTDSNTFNTFSYTHQKKRVYFANHQNNISFEFTSSDYVNTPKNIFEYKLEGYDKDWTLTNRNYVSYTQLPPGNYKFLVRASNNDGVWADAPASYSFRIRPMFWQTWWFRIIVVILFIIYLYNAINNRIQFARKKENERMQSIRQKTEYEKQLAEIKLKALIAQMNPHFIFNCMNSIQAMILSNQSLEASTYLTKLSRLVRSVLENSMKTFIPLQEVIDNLKLYLELESLRFDQQFNYDIQVKNIDTYSVELPSMLLQPYVENSIWHGLIKKEGEKNIFISFFKREKLLICEITDNGIGRAKAAELNLKKQHKSLGTIITKEMFETLHKIRDTNYHVEIIDLLDENGQAIGTKVVVKMELN
ncbi:MAG: hypothetical protein RJA25_1780 [Bacteroidota bacterium]|jgi:ligand-binding sensor domain-containing protein